MRELKATKTQPLFLVGLLLIAVLMTVRNIQGTVKSLPTLENEETGHHEETFIAEKSSILLSPSISKNDFLVSEQQEEIHVSTFNELKASQDRDHGVTPSALSVLQEVPNSNNTVVTIISMGRLVEKYLLERCIRSLRVGGAFGGYIMVFTDEIGFQAYQRSMAWDPKTKVVLGWNEDMIPMKNGIKMNDHSPPTNQHPIEYAQNTMVFKRFKTHHAKYIAADPDFSSSSVRYVLYVDVDIVVTNPLSVFFKDYVDMVHNEYDKWISHLNSQHLSTNFGFFSLFVDKHLKGKMHTGVILSDLMFHDKCVDSWRMEMDELYHKSDQVMLLNVIGNYTAYQCKPFELPAHHFNFANKSIMKERKKSSLPTFVHITEFRVRRIKDSDLHQAFLRFALDLREKDEMVDGITWDEAISQDARRPKLKSS